jgi:hypothetical protein
MTRTVPPAGSRLQHIRVEESGGRLFVGRQAKRLLDAVGVHRRNELLRGAPRRCSAKRDEDDGNEEVFCHQASFGA